MQLLVTKQPTAVDVVAGLQMQAVVDFRKISFLVMSLVSLKESPSDGILLLLKFTYITRYVLFKY